MQKFVFSCKSGIKNILFLIYFAPVKHCKYHLIRTAYNILTLNPIRGYEFAKSVGKNNPSWTRTCRICSSHRKIRNIIQGWSFVCPSLTLLMASNLWSSGSWKPRIDFSVDADKHAYKNIVSSRYLNVHLKLLTSQSKFSGPRKFTSRLQKFEITGVEREGKK